MLSSKEKKTLDDSMRHPCRLPETEDILAHYIDSGIFVDLRRKLKRFVVCSESSPRTRLYLLSTSAINWERSNHLRYYYRMIHPYSMFRFVWEAFMCIIYLILLTITPIKPLLNKLFFWPRLLLDVLGIIDIALTFRTGFQHGITKNVIMAPVKVSKKYLKSLFVFDVLATINSDIIIWSFQLDLETYWTIQLIEGMRLVRLITLLIYLDRVREWTSINLFKFNMMKLVIVIYLLIVWNSCILFSLAKILKESWFKREMTVLHLFRMCLLRIVETFSLVKHGDADSRNSILLIMEIFWITYGFVMKLVLTGIFVQIVLKQTSLSDKYYGIMQQFTEYMNSKNLPDSIRKRVLSYFQFRFNRNFFKESEILGNLSSQLRQEIIFHTRRELLTKSLMFRDLPNALLLRMGRVMKMEIFLPNDIVVNAGHHADVMYFMVSGMVAVHNTHGKELCHLGDGSYFGEAALFSNDRSRLATVVAIDFCEMFTLSHEDFSRTVAPYPDLLERILRICNSRLKQFLQEENLRFERSPKVKWNEARMYYNI